MSSFDDDKSLCVCMYIYSISIFQRVHAMLVVGRLLMYYSLSVRVWSSEDVPRGRVSGVFWLIYEKQRRCLYGRSRRESVERSGAHLLLRAYLSADVYVAAYSAQQIFYYFLYQIN